MRRINLVITAFLLLILVVYLAFLDALAKPIFESLASEQYGAEVSVDRLSLQPFFGRATLYELQVVDRRDAMRNLVQADRVYVDIDIIKLAGNVVDVSDMEVDGLLSFAPRSAPGTILRPLVEEDSPLAMIGLPDFEIPDVDALINRERDALEAEIQQLNQAFARNREKWKTRLEDVPGEADIKAYEQRIKALKNVKDPLRAVTAIQDVQAIYAEVNREIEGMRSLQQEFRGDLQDMREQIDLAGKLPEKYTAHLVESLGLSSEQMAQLGRQLLRGDLDGLLQQVLAPLAFNTSGEAGRQEQAMPIFIRRAAIKGSLLAAVPGLSVEGELKDFAWPLEEADNIASLLLSGSSLNGGSLQLDASVDHRGEPEDRVSVSIDDLPLKHMALAGTEELGIQLLQTLVDVSGELSVQGGNLDGGFTNRFSGAVFETTLAEGAGEAAHLIARVLETTHEFLMSIGFGGTLENPRLTFGSDMDQIFQSTIQGAIEQGVGELTTQLQQQISSEVGPEIAAARQHFTALEEIQAQLQRSLTELKGLAGQG